MIARFWQRNLRSRISILRTSARYILHVLTVMWFWGVVNNEPEDTRTFRKFSSRRRIAVPLELTTQRGAISNASVAFVFMASFRQHDYNKEICLKWC